MRTVAPVVVFFLLLAFAGCESPIAGVSRRQNREAEASGSPFRWRVESAGSATALTRVMIDLPVGSTRADGALKNEILGRIEKAECSNQRGAPEVDEVRLLPDGREVWILKNPRDGVAYVVRMKPSPKGGVDLSVDGPTVFERSRSIQ